MYNIALSPVLVKFSLNTNSVADAIQNERVVVVPGQPRLLVFCSDFVKDDRNLRPWLESFQGYHFDREIVLLRCRD